MSRRTWAAGMAAVVIPLATAMAVSTAPAATGYVVAPQAPTTSTVLPRTHRAVFPLTITRTGGIAGFQDVLVATRVGRVSITRRGVKQPACRLTPAAATRLRTAASLVPWARIIPDSGLARFPDDMVSMVRSPAGGPVRLENPRVAASGKVFQSLLSDVMGGPAASRMCQVG